MDICIQNTSLEIGGPFGEDSKGMVAPRYDSSHDEGFVDSRYSDQKGSLSKEGGPGSGPQDKGDSKEKKPKEKGFHGKDAIDILQDHARLAGRANEPDWGKMHDEFQAGFKRRAKQERQLGQKKDEDKEEKKKEEPNQKESLHKELGRRIAIESRRGSSSPVIINSSPESPASIPYEAPKRENGWRGGMVFSPPIKKLKSEMEGRLVVKEF